MNPAWLWIAFLSSLLALLAVDLIFTARKPHEISIRGAAILSAFWIGASLAFNLWIWHYGGAKSALEFFSAYVIEKSLSVDNLFVFVLLFRYFSIAPQYQHRVLAWGVLGALTLRGAMIAAGIAFVDTFSWALFGLGAFLIFASVQLLLRKEVLSDARESRAVAWIRRLIPSAAGDSGGHFFARENGKWMATPLFLALIAIEIADLIFAVDSIPAVIGVTQNAFIVFSSNACAILGLRALYFVLAGWAHRLRYLDKGISLILLFVGLKMVAQKWVQVPITTSLGVILAILCMAAFASMIDERKSKGGRAQPTNPHA